MLSQIAETILLVEDDEDLTLYWGHVLREAHFQGELVHADCLAGIPADVKPDLIVLDLYLPNGRGMATIDYCRNRFPDVPFIAASGADISLAEVMNAGADDFLSKGDISPNRLITSVIKAISRRRAKRELKPLENSVAKAQENLNKLQSATEKQRGT